MIKSIWNIISYPVLAVLVVLAAIEFIPALKVFFTHLAVYKWLLTNWNRDLSIIVSRCKATCPSMG